MKSAFECFQHASRCEDMALASCDDANRRVLLHTARQWRKLGLNAKRAGEGELTGRKQLESE